MIKAFRPSQSGFSTLMALGTIGVLLIIVVGLASVYIREMKLSRMTYNEIIAGLGAEGMFEYGMLKIRNHREGFADSVSATDVDATLMTLSSPRSQGMQATYTIEANSTDTEFVVQPGEHLIIPLFSAKEDMIISGGNSRKPTFSSGIIKTKDLTTSGLGDATWTIIATKDSRSIGISGSGNILLGTEGVIRHREIQCYSADGQLLFSCDTPGVIEELPYFWDEKRKISDFLSDLTITDPYFMVYNNLTNAITIHMRASTAFSLPEMTIESTAKKNDSSQVYRFTEDKSRYYDALKYGVYNN